MIEGALLAVLLGCGPSESGLSPAPVPEPTGWHVRAGALRAPDGRAVVLHGVNVANAHKQAPYFGFHQAVDFTRAADEWGMNSVRLLIIWAAIEPAEGQYDEAYLAEIGERLDWAAQAGLSVVLDMHQDVYGEGFGGDGAPRWSCDEAHYQAFQPTSPWLLNYLNEHVVACFDAFWSDEALQEHYLEAWRRVAERFGAHPAVIGFDPMNEPYWGSTQMSAFEHTVLQPFYVRLVHAVRAQAPGWLAFIEPAASRNLGVPTGLASLPFDGVVYAPHAYDPQAEQGSGFDPARRQGLIDHIAELATEAKALGAALWIGEYGGNAAAPGIDSYMDAAYFGVGAVAGSSMYWAYDRDGGYGLLAPDGSEKTELLDAVVRPYPEMVAGEIEGYAYDAVARRFVLRWRPRDIDGLRTEIVVPSRCYPAGYAVSCPGCAIERRTGRLLVRRAPSDDIVELRLEP